VAFIAGRRLDNKRLFISISTKGFTLPVGQAMRRSGCKSWLEPSTVFGPILESSRLPPTIPRALHGSGVDGTRVDSWGGFLAMSFLVER
jgi:hypothetical protein